MRTNEVAKLVAKSLKDIFNNDLFKDVYVTTEIPDTEKLLSTYKAIIQLNIMPDSEKERYGDHSVSRENFNIKTYITGKFKDRNYLIDIIDKIKEDLYFNKTNLDEEVVYTDFEFVYEAVPNPKNIFFFCGIINLEKND